MIFSFKNIPNFNKKIKIKGTLVTFTYHTDWYMGKEQGFWRADTDRGTITWNRSKTELKKEVRKILGK